MGEALSRIRSVHEELRLWLDIALPNYLKPDKGYYDNKIVDSANRHAMQYLKNIVFEKLGYSEEAMLVFGIFICGYIDGRLTAAAYAGKHPQEDFEYRI